MIKWFVAVTIGAIAVFFLYLANYTGFFKPVTISEGHVGPFVLLGKQHVGPYYKIVPKLQEVEAFAKEHNFECKKSFGLYYDNPETVEEARLKSLGGCLMNADEQVKADSLPEGYRVETFPEGDFVIAEFDGSPGIGPFKAYPKAQEYIQQKKYGTESWGILEIYEIFGVKQMKTSYYFRVNKTALVPQ